MRLRSSVTSRSRISTSSNSLCSGVIILQYVKKVYVRIFVRFEVRHQRSVRIYVQRLRDVAQPYPTVTCILSCDLPEAHLWLVMLRRSAHHLLDLLIECGPARSIVSKPCVPAFA